MFKVKFLLVVFALGLFAFSSNAQAVSINGQLGYAGAQGDMFKVGDEKMTSFGLAYEADVLYHLEALENKLGLGLGYYGSAIFGDESDDEGMDIGIYGLNVYGVKGLYRLRDADKTFTPYGSLLLGLSQFSTPDVTYGTETVEGKSAFSLGVKPEIGIMLGGFTISAGYLIPMKYTIESDTGDFEGTAGSYTISLGYRYVFDL